MTLERDASARVRPATLKDVAALAGVSIATVSKALNGREHVRQQTRERVQAAADQLNFQPNSLAQGLLGGRTGTVGLLTNDLVGRFSIPVLMGAEDAFGAGRASVLLCDARGDSIREQHHLRTLLSRRIDGLIVVGDNTDARESLGHNFPVPVVYAYSPSSDPDDISVVSDNVSAGGIAANHLIDCGRNRIAYVSGDVNYAAARDRVQGATQALAAAGLELLGGTAMYRSWSESWGRDAARAILQRFPGLDAILCGSDQIARGVVDALREAHIDIPAQIAVMGHDNWHQFASESQPPLSTIDMNLEEVGRTAARLLFAAIEGHNAPGIHRVPCKLMVRDSTGLLL